MTEHKNIATALASAQQQMGRALKDSTNPHFRSKYADLGNVMDACMSALNENGIAVIQPLMETEMGSRFVVTKFIHASGDVLECPVPLILGKSDMQGLGSAITYARRYGLMSLAGIAPDDDDGNAAVASAPKQASHAVREKSWSETVLQDLPEGATDRDKAVALKDAILGEYKRKKTQQQLENEWDRRRAVVDRIGEVFKDLHGEIIEAYEARMIELEPVDPAKVAAE